jgi:hypothetical protein
MAHARPRRRLARTAALTAGAVAGALVLGLVTGPAQATGGPYVVFRDSDLSSTLRVGDLTGAAPVSLTSNLVLGGFDASADGSVVAGHAWSGTYATADGDSSHGLVVSHNGAVRVLSTYNDAQPDVSDDGAVVWFVTDGQLYRYLPVDETSLIAWTSTSPYVKAGYDLSRISVSPDSTRIAVLYRQFSTTTPYPVIASRLEIYSNDASPVLQWASALTANPGPQFFYDVPRWADASTLLYGTCTTGTCDHWSYSTVDVSAVTPTPAAVTTLDGDLYNVQKVDGTWYAFSDTGTDPNIVTSYRTAPDLVTPLSSPSVDRIDGAHSNGYVVTNAAPAQFGTTSTNRAVTSASLVMASSTVKTGITAVYSSYAKYLRPLGQQSVTLDADANFRGLLQWSTDRAKTWHNRAWTTYPGVARTQKLTRNTWFRWVFPGDLLAAPRTSAVRLVHVSPTVTSKVTKSGSKKIVSGTAARVGGTIVLYKGSKKIATVKISAKGTFTFGKRTLSRGAYKLVAVADAYWTTGSKAFSI